MPESKYHRLALAQIAFNPAYLDDSVSYLHEPIFPADSERGLHKLAGLTEIHDLRASIAAALIEHMSHKNAAIADFVANQNTEVLVFPEYSASPELAMTEIALCECRQRTSTPGGWSKDGPKL
ncbi:MAG TPA: hypothetical protein VEJ67_02570 [Candidatus Cybelea sp.]|nr:hypothetical protein [Candidatus Cybelea sp.]